MFIICYPRLITNPAAAAGYQPAVRDTWWEVGRPTAWAPECPDVSQNILTEHAECPNLVGSQRSRDEHIMDWWNSSQWKSSEIKAGRSGGCYSLKIFLSPLKSLNFHKSKTVTSFLVQVLFVLVIRMRACLARPVWKVYNWDRSYWGVRKAQIKLIPASWLYIYEDNLNRNASYFST